MCCICQRITTEPLKCPLNVKGSGDKSEVYNSFFNNVSTFRGLSVLPIVLNFREDMTVSELVQNQAVWHKSFHIKFNNDKVDRAIEKRQE